MPNPLLFLRHFAYLSDSIRIGRFLPVGGKTGFSAEKTGVAKIVFAGKNSFLPPKFTSVVF